MKRYVLALFALAAFAVVGCETFHDDDDDDDGAEVSVPLNEVPAAAMAAAKKAVPGAKFDEAESEMENGVKVYCIEGTVDGEEVEVEVTADGKVLEVEKGDDEEDDDDDRADK
jgi:uncharacterized membrane protein YkoI